MCANFAPAAARQVIEPQKIASETKLKPGEGALRLSVRSQYQTTDTLFVYFIQLNEDGTDGERVLQFARGAGVPIMGSNMIDPKPQIYRVPEGRYRPLAFTVKCPGVPFEGAVCTGSFMGTTPTGYYRRSNPLLLVEVGKLSEAGDFIMEYNGTITDPRMNVMSQRKESTGYDLRWRAMAPETSPAFAGLSRTAEAVVPEEFKSRIRCDSRPAGVSLYIPFECE